MQRRPSTSTASSARAFFSLTPPLETNSSPSSTTSSAFSSMSSLGFSTVAPSFASRTRPARTVAAAAVREGANPRSASRVSARRRGIAPTVPRPGSPARESGATHGVIALTHKAHIRSYPGFRDDTVQGNPDSRARRSRGGRRPAVDGGALRARLHAPRGRSEHRSRCSSARSRHLRLRRHPAGEPAAECPRGTRLHTGRRHGRRRGSSGDRRRLRRNSLFGRVRLRAYGADRFNAIQPSARRLIPAYLPQTKKQHTYLSSL